MELKNQEVTDTQMYRKHLIALENLIMNFNETNNTDCVKLKNNFKQLVEYYDNNVFEVKNTETSTEYEDTVLNNYRNIIKNNENLRKEFINEYNTLVNGNSNDRKYEIFQLIRKKIVKNLFILSK